MANSIIEECIKCNGEVYCPSCMKWLQTRKFSSVVMQTNEYYTWDDSIACMNTSSQEVEWLQLVPSDPAEFMGCIAELATGSDEGCTGVDELIRYRDQLYIVQSIDLDFI